MTEKAKVIKKTPAPKKTVTRAPTKIEADQRSTIASLEHKLNKLQYDRDNAMMELARRRDELTQMQDNVEQQKIHADGKLQGALLALQAIVSKA